MSRLIEGMNSRITLLCGCEHNLIKSSMASGIEDAILEYSYKREVHVLHESESVGCEM